MQVCRILDPEGDVFNRSSLQHHLVCVSRQHKKSLKAALHHPLDANRYKADASELEDPDDVEQDDGVKEDDQVCPSASPKSFLVHYHTLQQLSCDVMLALPASERFQSLRAT